MKPQSIAFVIYGVTDIKKGRDFYENVLGLVPENTWIDEEKGMGMIEYGFGPDNIFTLAIGNGVEQFAPGKGGATVAIEVENFDEAIKKLKDANITFTLEAHESPVCWMASFLDPDGNQLMVHKRKNG